MKNIMLSFIFSIFITCISAQIVPFKNLNLQSKSFSIDKESPKLDINDKFVYSSNFLKMKKSDAVYVTCTSDGNITAEFYCRISGTKDLIAKVFEKYDVWLYDKYVKLKI
jgi:hypothetical protein